MLKEIKKGGVTNANDLNMVILSGRIAYEPDGADFCYTENNGARFNFKVRTDAVAKSQQIFRAVAWGARAEEFFDTCHKDDYVIIQGKLRKNNWVDGKNIVHDDAEIDVDRIEVVGA